MDDGVRKELIEYYKWIAGLAIFVLTVTLSVAALGTDFYLEYSYRIGAALLCLCIVCNWLVVKTLVAKPIGERTLAQGTGRVLHGILLGGINIRIKIYANLQHLSFLTGLAFVIYSLVW